LPRASDERLPQAVILSRELPTKEVSMKTTNLRLHCMRYEPPSLVRFSQYFQGATDQRQSQFVTWSGSAPYPFCGIQSMSLKRHTKQQTRCAHEMNPKRRYNVKIAPLIRDYQVLWLFTRSAERCSLALTFTFRFSNCK
jgi:hypothetical protein